MRMPAWKDIIERYYPEDTPLRRLLLRHSGQVRDKALSLLRPGMCRELVESGAMVHDVGIFRCHAPGILCVGEEPYLRHGVIGGELLRAYGRECGVDLEPLARVCERHTGAGITAQEVRREGLPLPERDWLPETPEERLICLADKFFSKSGEGEEKPLPVVRRSLEKFGTETLARFDALCREFL